MTKHDDLIGFGDRELQYTLAFRLGRFLIAQGHPSYGLWRGRLTAPLQRCWLGFYLGKGTLCVDGTAETLTMSAKVCFGTDSMPIVHLDLKSPAQSFCNRLGHPAQRLVDHLKDSR